jgi:hypothetical protein
MKLHLVFRLMAMTNDSLLMKVRVTSLCLTKYRAMNTYWGSGGVTPRILDMFSVVEDNKQSKVIVFE